MNFDVCIVGTGPAGLFAAINLVKKGITNICVLDKNSYSSGGMANDGKLNFHHKVGMDCKELNISVEDADIYMKTVLHYFQQTGCLKEVTYNENEKFSFWKKRIEYFDSELIIPRQFHYGTDNAKKVIDHFVNYLKENGVTFMLNTEVITWKKEQDFNVVTNKGTIKSKYLILAPGRYGAHWCREQAWDNNVKTKFGPIDIGIRVELNSKFYAPIIESIYDPKIKIGKKRNVRTFCTNPGGRVRIEKYNHFNLVNGDALANSKTENTNFALLRTIKLTEPFVDSTKFAHMIAKQFYLLTENKVLVQRVGDLREGKRSKKSTFYSNPFYYHECTPTLKEAVPGDVTLGFSAKIWYDLWQSLKTLDKICPGILHPSTLIYAPEIKFYDTQYITDRHCQTNIENLYVIGDGCGKSRGIVGAAISGLIATDNI